MPITFEQIANNTASVTIQPTADPDATLTINFYPGHITEEVFAQLSAISKLGKQMQDGDGAASAFTQMNEVICPLIASWDAYEDAERTTMIPTTPERFKRLPIPFRLLVLNSIMDAFSPELTPSQAKTRNS